MYYSLNGTLLHKELGLAVIDCGGVGYKCFCSLNTLKALGEIGSPAFVFTYLGDVSSGRIVGYCEGVGFSVFTIYRDSKDEK